MKKYADSTLNMCTKAELIEMIRCLEQYSEGLQEQNNRQFNLLLSMVEPVRCKDCKYSVENDGSLVSGARYCKVVFDGVSELVSVWDTDYCSYGKKGAQNEYT